MLQFISFGSGSSGNCYALYTDNDGIIIDAGRGIRTLKKFMKDYGIPQAIFHHMLITHDHADHVKSVGMLSSQLNLPVYTSALVHQGINRNYCVRAKIPPQLVRFIQPQQPFTLGEFSVTPISVPHDSTDNLGYRIEHQGIVFTLLTDVGHVTPDIAAAISESNYLVLEANHDVEMLAVGPYPQHLKDRITSGTGHLSNRLCAEALANNATEKLHHVWLCHLSEENNHPELARKTVEQILRSYGIIPGKDFQLDVLKRTVPTGVYNLL